MEGIGNRVIDEFVMNEHTLHLNIHWLLCHNI